MTDPSSDRSIEVSPAAPKKVSYRNKSLIHKSGVFWAYAKTASEQAGDISQFLIERVDPTQPLQLGEDVIQTFDALQARMEEVLDGLSFIQNAISNAI